ncbi:NAD(P)/FAD-dependent oxidoreductase [Kineosporia mesophila]|uniref:NAD(P)/FAD-dependent oxidoreductase n=1 Tax=Kineosporia mesophila TaxID=566012 RepID=A0ABP6ZLV7_9ACTN|nr:NAD(P)/FAD-dependent oxidoreductase [Kineosporia mesophila]MCD5354472.1 NAD(P)/FAD-dependent oxidoreductase [Kineosporia mesophila]
MSEPSKVPAAQVREEVEVLIIGAGVTGLYQLQQALEAGLSVRLLEAGGGVGGTWYWNRYPEARFDSESYSYGFLFSEELWREWEWSEKYAAQPEVERYFNHVVDRFGLRQYITFGSKVISAVFDEASGTYTVGTQGGDFYRTRFLVAASGNLSVPFIPAIAGRESFRGGQYHTGRWPEEGVDLTGQRVAQIGTGSSGVQIVPAIAGQVEQLTVYQMKADWVTPLNNGPLTEDEKTWIRENFEEIRQTLNTSPSGFAHDMRGGMSTDATPEEHQAMFEKMWASEGFRKLTETYWDLLLNSEINGKWCAYLAGKIRSIVKDPVTAERLIPKDSGYGGRRPPFGTGYFEAYNNPNVELVSLPETPILRITETGIETTEGLREVDLIIWGTGWDFGTGALNRLGLRGREGLALEEYWSAGPQTYLGIMTAGFPNFFFPGGPHGATGNNPRYAGDQVEYTTEVIRAAKERGSDVVEVEPGAQDQWTTMVNDQSHLSSFLDSSYFSGGNIPGKPVKQLLNPTGRPTLQKMIADDTSAGHPALRFSRASRSGPVS